MKFQPYRVSFPLNPPPFLFLVAAVLLCLPLANTLLAASALASEISVSGVETSIQDVINTASPGDIIVVDDGKYDENLFITKEILLRSKNGSGATLLFPKDPKHPVISIMDASGVKVTGFTIKNSASSGVAVYRSRGVKIFDNRITGHVNGLFLDNTNESAIFENVTTENEKGVYLYFSNNNLIEKNKMDSNVNNGLLLHSSHKNIIKENTANSNYWNGITLSSSNDNVVEANESLRNTYAIVVSESTGNQIADNKTMRRLYRILPVILVYVSIMVYLIERRLFILFYDIKNKEHGKLQGLR